MKPSRSPRFQFAAERRSRAVRVQNLKLDQRLEQLLAFSGRGE